MNTLLENPEIAVLLDGLFVIVGTRSSGFTVSR